jgi:hypothetical protein
LAVTIADRLRVLDESVLGPPSTDAQQRPPWVRFGVLTPGLWFLLVYDAVKSDGLGWTIAAVVYGLVAVPCVIASALWHRRHGTGRFDRHALWAVALLFLVGGSIVAAGAVAPNGVSRLGGVSYPTGCHPAPKSLADKLRHYIHGNYRLDTVVTYGSANAAVASALVSGTMVIGGANFPIEHEVADWQLRPGPIAASNSLASEISPNRQPAMLGVPFGTGGDEVRQDQAAAENCVTNLRG